MIEPLTPLLAADSILDAGARSLVETLFLREQQRVRALPSDDPLNPIRRRRVEITRTEIAGQPQTLAKTLDTQAADVAAIARTLASAPLSRVVMTGCGDSWAVMMGARLLMEQLLGIPCEPMQALDFAYYFNRPIGPETLVVTLSSTGTTPRTVEALMMAKALGARTLALSNTPGSALMAEAEFALLVHAERKGWPTQASTASMGLLMAFAIALGRERGLAASAVEPYAAALDRIAGQIDAAIPATEPQIVEIAARESSGGMFLFAAGGPSYASAFFGAAKVKECTPDHALAIPLEEFHHFHSQKKGEPLFLTAPAGPSRHRARDTAEEGRKAGGRIYAIVTESDPLLSDVADAVISLPAIPEPLAPLLYTVPAQLFAYHLAMAKFAAAERALS